MPYPIQDNIDAESTDELKFSVRKLMIIGILMAATAGFINSAMLIEFAIPVSQMTGVASRISDAAVHWEPYDLLANMAILFGFFLGALISGLMIGKAQYKTSANYGHALFLNSGLLGAATLSSLYQSEATLFFSAVACGLQNALVTSYRGQQLRTSHMTGTVTDLGVHLAHKLKTREPWPWKANLLIALLVGFLIGGVLGILAFRELSYWSMLIPSFITALLGVFYLRKYYRQTRQ